MNPTETIQDLRWREDRLNQQITDAQRRVESIREVIAMYEEEQAANAKSATPRNGTFGAQLNDAIEAILREESPLHRKVVLERVIARGIHVGGKNPMNKMSTYLSQSDRFKPDGRKSGVWTLVEDAEAGDSDK